MSDRFCYRAVLYT